MWPLRAHTDTHQAPFHRMVLTCPQEEPFAPVFTVVRVPCADAAEYMAKASAFSNEVLWGTLSCSVLLHPDVQKQHPAEVEEVGGCPCAGSRRVGEAARWSLGVLDHARGLACMSRHHITTHSFTFITADAGVSALWCRRVQYLVRPVICPAWRHV